MNTIIERHLGNISRLVGHDVTNKYSYIVNESDLINAYLQMHNDLGYPLMLESTHRRAIVYNKQGLEKKIQQMIAEVIGANGQKLADLVTNEVVTQLNNITQMANGQVVAKKSNQSNSIGKMVGGAIGKGLVNGFFNILDDITSYDENR